MNMKKEEYHYSFCIVKNRSKTNHLMDNLVKKVIKKTGATSLDWNTTYAGDLIYIKQKKDKPLVPGIINAVLAEGFAVFMSQGSGVDFPQYSTYSKRLFDMRLLKDLSYMECMGEQYYFKSKGLSLKAEDWDYPEDVRAILEAIVALRKTKINLRRDLQADRNRLTDPIFKEEFKQLQIQRNKSFMKYVAPTAAWIENFKVIQAKIATKWPNDDDPVKDSTRPLSIDLTVLEPPLKKQKTPPMSPIPSEEEEEEDPDDFFPPAAKLCVICMERPPTTMVLPCRHCVACKTCSELLKSDPINSKICVTCRQDITFILD